MDNVEASEDMLKKPPAFKKGLKLALIISKSIRN